MTNERDLLSPEGIIIRRFRPDAMDLKGGDMFGVLPADKNNSYSDNYTNSTSQEAQRGR